MVWIVFACEHTHKGNTERRCDIMKEVDISSCILVHAGQEWEYDQQPCSKDMIPLLERKENYCSWFQPINGTVDDQFPAMRIKSKYYLLSLRVQKAVFRHVRLRRGFVNREYVPDGRVKLRIPQPLLLEKRRTAKRFMVCLYVYVFITCLILTGHLPICVACVACAVDAS